MNVRPAAFVRIAVLAATAASLVLGACGSSGSSATSSDTGKSTTTSRPKTQAGTQLRGKRYCEVLLLHPAPAGITADVYNTFPINDCPEAQWKAMDPRAIAQENSMLAALLNGPRYWLMDAIEKNDTGAPVQKSFGGMEMIQRATVVVGNPVEASKPYVQNAVDRRTVFSFDKGRTVYELTTAGRHQVRHAVVEPAGRSHAGGIRPGIARRQAAAPGGLVLRRPHAHRTTACRHHEHDREGGPGRAEEQLLEGDVLARAARQTAQFMVVQASGWTSVPSARNTRKC